MKNRLCDLSNHLFEQIERLSDGDLTPEEMTKECTRASSIVGVSKQIIEIANTQLDGARLYREHTGELSHNSVPLLTIPQQQKIQSH